VGSGQILNFQIRVVVAVLHHSVPRVQSPLGAVGKLVRSFPPPVAWSRDGVRILPFSVGCGCESSTVVTIIPGPRHGGPGRPMCGSDVARPGVKRALA